MNFTAIRKSNDYDMIQLQNQQFTNKTLHERECSTELLCSQKVFLKVSQISLENTCAEWNVNVKVWFIHTACIFITKKTVQLFFSGFCRTFKNTFLLEHSWASASDIIFDIFKSNKYMKGSFLFTVFYKKSKIKQKRRLALKLGNLRIALQWSHSFVEPLLLLYTKHFPGN